MKLPFISYILPVYKIKEEYLKNAVESILKQTDSDLEVILVDDGSPDNCGELCDSFAEKDIRVKSIHQENKGVSVARNVGIKNASGEWIAFVDPDDWIDGQMVEKLKSFVYLSDFDVVFFDYYRESNDKSENLSLGFKPGILSESECNILSFAPIHKLKINNKISRYGAEVVWNKIYRRSFLEKSNVWFEENVKLGEDRIFNTQLLIKTKKIGYCSEYLYHYRVVAESATNSYNPNIILLNEKTIMVLKRWISTNDLPSEYLSSLNAFICNRGYSYLRLFYLNKRSGYNLIKINRELKEMTKREPYQSALKSIDYSKISNEEKVYVFLWKHNFAYICILLAWLRKKLK